MNIFVVDPSPLVCAEYLDDIRANKMLLETTQLLCTALNYHAGSKITPYKSTHINHPCTVWARETKANWLWLYTYAIELSARYIRHRGRRHKCTDILVQLLSYIEHLPEGGQTPFVNCARNRSLCLDFTDIVDVHQAYQKYLTKRWSNDVREPTWMGVSR